MKLTFSDFDELLAVFPPPPPPKKLRISGAMVASKNNVAVLQLHHSVTHVPMTHGRREDLEDEKQLKQTIIRSKH